MCSYRRIIALLLVFCSILLFCGCGGDGGNEGYSVKGALIGDVDVQQLSSNRFTQLEAGTNKPLPLYSLEGYKPVCDNDNLALYIDEETASIRVLDKKSGFVWGALTEKDPENLNKSWGSFAQSVVSISYMDKTGSTKQIGAGHSSAKCRYKYNDNSFTCSVDFGRKVDISLKVEVTLTEDSLHYAVDDSSIKESGENFIAMLYFTPFFGSTQSDQCDGYLFVPDGSGALIRYQKPKKYLKGYSERVYGMDYAIDNLNELNDLKSKRPVEMLKENSTVIMPIFGVALGVNQNAVLGRVASGECYAYINASPAGVVTDYNWAAASFLYRQVYSQPTSKNGAGVPVVQKTRNAVNPELDIYFLSGADANYSGMAAKYSEILNKSGILKNNIEATASELFLDFVAADVKKGLIGSSEMEVTSLEYIKNAVKYLSDNKICNTEVSVLGWQSGGLSGYKKSEVYKDSVVGSLDDLKKLKESISKNGGELSLYTDPLRAREIQINSRVDAGINLSQSPICKMTVDKKRFLGDIWYLKTAKAMEYLKGQFDILSRYNLTVSIDGGHLLYGEYLVDNFVSREDTKELLIKQFEEISKKQQDITVYNPNEYLLPYVSVFRNTPMSCNQEIYITDSVPFLQLVLSGNVLMTTPYINENLYSKIDLLKCIEYNLYPSFILTQESNLELKDTTLSNRVSTCFDNWNAAICDTYSFVCEALKNVRGKHMLCHQRIAETVFRTVYENGTMYINYGEDEYITEDGGSVKPQSFYFCEVKGNE